ncbi:MAG TPA: FecR domain-containing protein, partial [Polyangiales bacterium]
MRPAGRARPASIGGAGGRSWWAWLAPALLSLLLACGKSCSCGEDFLAQLEGFQGEVQRDEANSVGSWSAVANGERFQMGDGLRTGRKGHAQLSLAGSGVALVQSNTVLRFVDRDPRGKSRFDLEQGDVRIDSGEYDIDIETPRGLARMSKGSSLRIVSNGEDAQFDVFVGQVAIDHAGQSSALGAGDKLELTGAATNEPGEPSEVPAEPTVELIDAGAPAPVQRSAPAMNQPRGAELAMPEIDAMTLHAPSLPVTFRVQSPPCNAEKGERPNADLDGRSATPDPGGDGLLLSLV